MTPICCTRHLQIYQDEAVLAEKDSVRIAKTMACPLKCSDDQLRMELNQLEAEENNIEFDSHHWVKVSKNPQLLRLGRSSTSPCQTTTESPVYAETFRSLSVQQQSDWLCSNIFVRGEKRGDTNWIRAEILTVGFRSVKISFFCRP